MDRISEKLWYKDKVEGITSVAPTLVRIVVTTKNATAERKPDPDAVEKIKKKIKGGIPDFRSGSGVCGILLRF